MEPVWKERKIEVVYNHDRDWFEVWAMVVDGGGDGWAWDCIAEFTKSSEAVRYAKWYGKIMGEVQVLA